MCQSYHRGHGAALASKASPIFKVPFQLSSAHGLPSADWITIFGRNVLIVYSLWLIFSLMSFKESSPRIRYGYASWNPAKSLSVSGLSSIFHFKISSLPRPNPRILKFTRDYTFIIEHNGFEILPKRQFLWNEASSDCLKWRCLGRKLILQSFSRNSEIQLAASSPISSDSMSSPNTWVLVTLEFICSRSISSERNPKIKVRF